MPNFKDRITGFVLGDDHEVRRTVTGVPEGQTITKAWLTIKLKEKDADDDAVLQKSVTTTDQPGIGQIEEDASGDPEGTAVVRFDLTNADTAPLIAQREYFFDVQVLTSADKLYTPFKGKLKGEGEITKTTD